MLVLERFRWNVSGAATKSICLFLIASNVAAQGMRRSWNASSVVTYSVGWSWNASDNATSCFAGLGKLNNAKYSHCWSYNASIAATGAGRL